MPAVRSAFLLFLVIGAMSDSSLAQTISPPELIEPYDGIEKGLLPGHIVPRFVWMRVEGAAAYELQVGRDSTAFQEIIQNEVIMNGSSEDDCRNADEYVCRYFEHLGTFEWRVRTIGDADTSAWSATWHLTVVMGVGTIDETPASWEVKVVAYPNPAAGLLVVEVDQLMPESAKLSAFDMLGREVTVLYEGLLPQGKSRHEWDTSELARGSYLLILRMESGNVVQHVMLH